MAGSNVSTSNQLSTARRRALYKDPMTPVSGLPPAATGISGSDAVRLTAVDSDLAIQRDSRRNPQTQSRKSTPARRSSKPRWITVMSILTKNIALLVVILGLVQISRWAVLNSDRNAEGFEVISGDFEGKFAEVQRFVKTTLKAMQVQVDAIDRKIEDGVGSVREEFGKRMEKNEEEVGLKLKALDVRNDAFEKFIDGFRAKSLLSKEEFGEFFQEFIKSKNNGISTDVGLDEIKEFAREIVEKEIEKHAADGLGMVDYALASGGGRVIKHSEAYGVGKIGGFITRNKVAAEPQKMLMPSFGEPGHCFPLKGDKGFVVIQLKTAIVPEAVTLEHVAKSVAYDRSSAPKNCRVSGWLADQESSDTSLEGQKMFLLSEFTYDLEKSNAQTFKVLDSVKSTVVNTVRLDFESNHGSASYTCIYRLRVHGHEVNSLPQP
ncbi:SUN domain-containing protein 2-like [Dorcoceras hygrometricum]|uniref:SUN domain-containing protein 2-like n=1 Tax=Dorcoceras hygrometricum TaxID=472368 RepID=A0A2Z7ACE1_9LAMI|nr:SUN domain-containing protein 2-like [Dorcoceras hygrometricum]